jgi:hypothetical protein
MADSCQLPCTCFICCSTAVEQEQENLPPHQNRTDSLPRCPPFLVPDGLLQTRILNGRRSGEALPTRRCLGHGSDRGSEQRQQGCMHCEKNGRLHGPACTAAPWDIFVSKHRLLMLSLAPHTACHSLGGQLLLVMCSRALFSTGIRSERSTRFFC